VDGSDPAAVVAAAAAVAERVPLGPLTSLGIGGPAELFARPRTRADLAALLAQARERQLPVRILGGGTNLLVADAGVPGLVIRLDGPEFRRVEVRGATLLAGAGAPLAAAVSLAAAAGLAGIEELAGIPGTVGGAVAMNSGGHWGRIGDVVRAVEVLTLAGQERRLVAADCPFAARAWRLEGQGIILAAELALAPDDPEQTLERVRERIERRTRSLPRAGRSAGCFFRNPGADRSAGKLIDEAGLKGRRVGGARVAAEHANFILNDGAATAAEVLALVAAIKDAVRRKHGVELELEVPIWT